MALTPDEATVGSFSNVLAQTVVADKQKRVAAEAELKKVEGQPGYAVVLLTVVSSAAVKEEARLAAALTFKNFIKARWETVSSLVHRGGFAMSLLRM
jgi:hypothetical protein